MVGAPAGPCPMDRVDAARSGGSRAPLPTGTLHVAWRRNLGLPIEAAPVVDGRGDVTVVTARGDLIVLAADGEERSNTVVGSAAAGPAVLLSDGTAAFLTTASDVVGIRLGAVRFRRHVGGGRSNVSPLALADGGLVVATSGELVSLDGEGNVRARVAVDPDDPPSRALVGAKAEEGGTIYALSASGTVVAWTPAAGTELARVGSFGGPTDGGMVLVRGAKGHGPLLVAVAGTELVALDPLTGQMTTRATAAGSGALALLGPPAAQPSLPGQGSSLLPPGAHPLTHTGARFRRERHRNAPPPGRDFDPPSPSGRRRKPRSGTSSPRNSGRPPRRHRFALPSGELGVVTPAGTVDLVSEVCTRFGAPAALASLGIRGGPTFAGMAPAAPSALVVACGIGVVARIDSDFAPAP